MQGTRWALALLQACRLTLLEGAPASPLTADDGTNSAVDDRFEHVHDLNNSIKAIEDVAKLSLDEGINFHTLSRFSEELQETAESKRENNTMSYLDRLIKNVKTRIIRQRNFPIKNFINIEKINGRRKINRPNKDAKPSKDSKSSEDAEVSKGAKPSDEAKLRIESNSDKDAKSSKDAEPSQKAKPNKPKLPRKQLKKRRNSLNYEDVEALTWKIDKRACFYKKKQGHGKGPVDHPICCNCCQFSVLGCS